MDTLLDINDNDSWKYVGIVNGCRQIQDRGEIGILDYITEVQDFEVSTKRKTSSPGIRPMSRLVLSLRCRNEAQVGRLCEAVP